METSDIGPAFALCKDYIDAYKKIVTAMEHRASAFSSIDARQRGMLVNWMGEVCEVYNLSVDTFAVSVFVLDSYTSVQRLPIGKLQLLAGTCVYVAGKYEERYYPALSELVFICDRLYTENEFLDMQIEVLNRVQFRLTRINHRFSAILLIYGADVEREFLEAVDSVSQTAIHAKPLTFARPSLVGDAIIDIVVNGLDIPDDDTATSVKRIIVNEMTETGWSC